MLFRVYFMALGKNGNWLQFASTVVLSPPQASRLIVTFDEHVISNNFKFGVIYQKLGQVSSFSPTPGWIVFLGLGEPPSDLIWGVWAR